MIEIASLKNECTQNYENELKREFVVHNEWEH